MLEGPKKGFIVLVDWGPTEKTEMIQEDNSWNENWQDS